MKMKNMRNEENNEEKYRIDRKRWKEPVGSKT